MLKQSSFTFTAPKVPPKSSETAELPNFSSIPSSSRPNITSKVTSEEPSPIANPIDWSSLTTFDPAILNLLDDPVSQPTATEGAMQLDFGFGQNTGLASNAPYTTIASNPTFMSFASTFDSPSNSSGTAPNTFLTSPFNFDMNSMSAWSPSQDPQLDDLFAGYLSTMNPTDFSLPSQPSTSVNPVSHHNFRPDTSQTPSSSSLPLAAPQISKSSQDVSLPASEETGCPKAKLKEIIASADPSPFIMHGVATTTPAVPCPESGKLPKTIKSDKNVEMLTAWNSITSDPKYKVRF